MQAQTIALPARVAKVLENVNTWTAGRRKADGKRFYFIPSCTSDAVYMTAVDACTCPAAQNSRTGDCKHQEAVRQHSVTVRVIRPRYASLFPECTTDGCYEIAEGKDGLCDRCASDREHDQRMASKREVVARGTVKEAWL